MTTCYLVKDMNGRAAANTTVTVEYAGVKKQALSNGQGIAKFDENIPYDAKVYSIGLATVTRILCPQPPPTTTGDRAVERVGTSCTIVGRQRFGREFFWVVHDSQGAISSGYDTVPPARTRANELTQCFEQPVTTPDPLTDLTARTGVVEDALQGLRKAVEGISSRLDTLYAWLVDRVLEAILEALDREVMKRGR